MKKSISNKKKKEQFVYNVTSALELITSSDNELKERWGNYLELEYEDPEDASSRLFYIDVGEIARFIIEKYKGGQTGSFSLLFNNIENILGSCDKETKDLITVGLFEGIQNIGGSDIDYYFGFNKWLYTLTGEQWRAVIDFWEGTEWRQKRK
jgi:hypothetical protein